MSIAAEPSSFFERTMPTHTIIEFTIFIHGAVWSQLECLQSNNYFRSSKATEEVITDLKAKVRTHAISYGLLPCLYSTVSLGKSYKYIARSRNPTGCKLPVLSRSIAVLFPDMVDFVLASLTMSCADGGYYKHIGL